MIINLFSEFLDLKQNFGVAFGLFNNAPEFSFTLSILALIIIFSVIYFSHHERAKIFLAIMAGGAISNLLSRIFYGYVIDYIYIHVPFSLIDLHFNLADVEIALGALGVLIYPKK